jgi:hypothetical protein
MMLGDDDIVAMQQSDPDLLDEFDKYLDVFLFNQVSLCLHLMSFMLSLFLLF